VTRRRNEEEFLDTYRSLKRYLTTLVGQTYAELGLGTTQVRLLEHVAANGGVSQAELSRATESDPALTGRALQTLIDRKWVLRTRSPDDRRAYVLQIGAAGRRVLDRVEELRIRLRAKVVTSLDERDLADFKRIVSRILLGA
jgi:DNA-binding MarR family transcriptional regulator